ncbi:GH32 C-terminal domain-containing protein [Microbacterium sp. ZW T5_56]|uniref:GH32 C-terminal domain-containing protein n=1 Tax=Microbacterium sp. ZW T5_56 TaxID=3378081 RepID=UPI0038554BF9
MTPETCSMHFRPARNWMNDPNGLIRHDDRYHLFYQYNPHGPTHGYLSWGHASSVDLVSWTEHPVAIEYTPTDEIFSGSAVLDAQNTSGLGVAGAAPLVAVYTLAARTGERQTQGIASSTDGGHTWAPYPGNPVLDRGSAHFRDPKVFRYQGADDAYWVMVAVEAVERRVVLYRSDDLITWDYLSDYGPRGATEGVWECPDLFPLAVDGDPDDVRWVLLISINPGGIAGGSGTQYVIGHFDGVRFVPDDAPPRRPAGAVATRAELAELDWLDHGRDCYAGVTFSGLPDDERTLIAWMSNWEYAGGLAVDDEAPRRGAMTLARRLSLVRRQGRVLVRQQPVAPATDPGSALSDTSLTSDAPLQTELPARCRVEVLAELPPDGHLRLDLGGSALVEVDAAAGELRLDRRPRAGAMPDGFASVESVGITTTGIVRLEIWLDHDSAEIFADDGTRVITDLLAERGRTLVVSARGDEVLIRRLSVDAVRVDDTRYTAWHDAGVASMRGA